MNKDKDRSQSLFGRCGKQQSLLPKPGTKPLFPLYMVCSLVTIPTDLLRLPYRRECASQFEKKNWSAVIYNSLYYELHTKTLAVWRFTDRKDLEIRRRIILKRIVHELDGTVWTEFTWLRRGTMNTAIILRVPLHKNFFRRWANIDLSRKTLLQKLS